MAIHPRASGTSQIVLRELLLLLLTLALGIALVALLIFAPRAFIGDGRSPPGLANYLGAVGDYLGGLLRGDFGRAFRPGSSGGRPVGRELLVPARRTLELVGLSALVALPLGLLWGAALATVRRRLPAALLFGLSTLVVSLPSFAVLLLTIEAVANLTLRTGIRLTYVQGYGLDRHLLLPVGVLALRGAAFLSRALQVAQEEIMRQDWVRVARAKGLGGLALWQRHVLPALRLPLLGGALGMLRVIVGGMVIVDFVYNWGGLGRKLLQVNSSGVVNPAGDQMAAGAAVLLVLFFVLTDALGRLLLRGLDPRIREAAQER